jgi:hypothetical protein
MRQFINRERIDAELVKTRPDVWVTISREIDRYAVWDMTDDNGNPEEQPDDIEAYDWTVKVWTIRNGKMITAETYLGNSWCGPEEPVDDVNGYFDGMLHEALGELDKVLPETDTYAGRCIHCLGPVASGETMCDCTAAPDEPTTEAELIAELQQKLAERDEVIKTLLRTKRL